MATLNVTSTVNSFRVIHPLDDVVEQKCSTEGLGKIKMTRAVRISLGVLRSYLILMTLKLGYHVVDLTGLVYKVR